MKVRGVWRKSTYSGGVNTTCVEVAEMARGLAVRDSKDLSGPHIAFGATDWHRFMSRVTQAN